MNSARLTIAPIGECPRRVVTRGCRFHHVKIVIAAAKTDPVRHWRLYIVESNLEQANGPVHYVIVSDR